MRGTEMQSNRDSLLNLGSASETRGAAKGNRQEVGLSRSHDSFSY